MKVIFFIYSIYFYWLIQFLSVFTSLFYNYCIFLSFIKLKKKKSLKILIQQTIQYKNYYFIALSINNPIKCQLSKPILKNVKKVHSSNITIKKKWEDYKKNSIKSNIEKKDSFLKINKTLSLSYLQDISSP